MAKKLEFSRFYHIFHVFVPFGPFENEKPTSTNVILKMWLEILKKNMKVPLSSPPVVKQLIFDNKKAKISVLFHFGPFKNIKKKI